MRNKISKLGLTLMLVLCMTMSVFAVTMAADADSTEIAWDEYTQEKYNNLETGEIPSMDGYLFGGWYKQKCETFEDECANVLSTVVIPDGGVIFAKFVPKAVLGVQAQVSAGDLAEITDDASLRFVTSVDSLVYKEVGFDIEYVKDGITTPIHCNSKQVYDQLLATDGSGKIDTSFVPSQMFNKESEYFKTCTITKISAKYCDLVLKVTPYWITVDGTPVYGETVSKTLSQGMTRLSDIYVSSEGNDGASGTQTAPIKTLSHAMYRAGSKANIIVMDDIEAQKTATVTSGKSITVTNKENSSATVSRGKGLAASWMFNVAENGTLTINGITLDGRTADEIAAENTTTFSSSSASLIESAGTVNFENAKVQYVYKEKENGQGGVYNSISGAAAVSATNTQFLNNKTTNVGGVIFVDNGKLTLDGCTFTNNSAGRGGAIGLTSATAGHEISNCTFQSNKATATEGFGGAIYTTKILNVEKSKFIGNKATGTSSHGGAIYTTKELTIDKSNFDGNETTVKGSHGGAIFSSGAALTITGDAAAEQKNYFQNNISKGSGGAIYVDSNVVLNIEYYRFYNNDASRTGGGAIALRLKVNGNLKECEFQQNKASQGGALWTNYTGSYTYTLTITDCLFKSNSTVEPTVALTTPYGGGAIWANSSVKITLIGNDETKAFFEGNTIYSSESVESLGKDIYLKGSLTGSGYAGLTEDGIFAVDGSTNTYVYSEEQ